MSFPAKRSHAFRETRGHHNSESAEDYTELIAELIETQGEARTCEIANHVGVSHVTAIKTIQRLQKEGYVKTAPHQPVFLTSKGQKLANFAKVRHSALLNFFLMIGVPPKIAEIDVEGAEHHISPTTLKCIQLFTERQLQDN